MSSRTVQSGTTAPPPQKRQVAACPWCGAGSDLGIVGDGFGGVALSCARCGARGPCVPLGDVAASDEAAIAHWSRRSRPVLPADLVERVRVAIGLHRLTATLSADAAISVAYGDLDVLLRAASA